MKRYRLLALMIACMLLVPLALGETVTLVDDAEREVTLVTHPRRAIILDILPLPSVLTVFLGSAESIVAMEPASMAAARNGILGELYPEVLSVSTDIMAGDDVNLEALLALAPDVVYYNASNKALREQLDNAGLPAVAISPSRWGYDCIETYDRWIDLLSKIYPGTGLPAEVSAYSRSMAQTIAERTASIPEGERRRVLFLFQYGDHARVTSGKSFFGQWWCDATGSVNVAEEISADNKNAAFTMEQVYAWDPEVILITNFTTAQPEDLYANAIGGDDWSAVDAVKNRRVYKMPLGTYRSYTPGVDTPITLEWLSLLLYPDLFPEFDLARDVRAYYESLYGIQLTDAQIEAMLHPSSAASAYQ